MEDEPVPQTPEATTPPPPQTNKEIETSDGPDYNDNPDPRLFAYNLFGELEPIGKPQRQPKQPQQPEEKPKPTITVTDTQAKKFRPLSDKELEFYGSLDWETNPPINGFYETMMSIAHRQLAEMEAERQAMEATKKETITEDGSIIEISKGDFLSKPRVATEAPKPTKRDMSPRPFSEDIQ
ncbi:hypothetical protein, partial [uncultured Duncaniella sp.]|uniref:hypothetical protein n=1 Tax=uncultured Duncaniella sp. TaxID=2768039 RepID=UPI0025B6725E